MALSLFDQFITETKLEPVFCVNSALCPKLRGGNEIVVARNLRSWLIRIRKFVGGKIRKIWFVIEKWLWLYVLNNLSMVMMENTYWRRITWVAKYVYISLYQGTFHQYFSNLFLKTYILWVNSRQCSFINRHYNNYLFI